MNKSAFTQSQPRQRSTWTTGYIIGDPFFLTTISIGLIGWIIAFAASLAANVSSNLFPHFAWWAIVYELGCIIGVIVVVGYDTIDAYRVALVGFLAAALSFTTSITNTLIYSPRASDEAVASGHLFLSIINIVWIFYFGTTSAAAPHAWVDSYAITRSRPITSTPQMSSTAPFASLQPNYNNPTSPTYGPQTSLAKRETFPESRVDSVIEEPTSYPHRAKAIYAYEADMKDPNEISFAKGEVLEVSADITSKWWTVRKTDGTRGIAPSNYLGLES